MLTLAADRENMGDLLDYQAIREDFPLLQTKMNGKPLVFLDSAASSQKPQRVIDAFNDYYRCRNANIHRGAYRLSYEATDLYERTREMTARFLGAAHPESCIFTRNATESINLVARAWGDANIEAGDEILLNELEHHSNLVPWFMLAERRGATIRHIPLTADYQLDLSRLDEVVNARTRVIAVQHMSNALGVIHDLKTLAAKARSVGALFVVDGAQGASHLRVNVTDLDCDFYALSAHKMLGPTGIGVLYGKRELLDAMPPFLGGGDMILTVWKDGFRPAPLPNKFEAGTPNIAGVVAFAIALDYLEKVGLERIHRHELAVLRYAIDELRKIPGLTLYGTEDLSVRGGVLSFNVDGVHPHDVGTILDEEGIAIRAGHHCCEPLMRLLDAPGTARASFYLYNGPEDVDALVRALNKVRDIFRSAVKS